MDKEWEFKFKSLEEDEDKFSATIVAENPNAPFLNPAKCEELPEHFGKYLVDGINNMNRGLIDEELQSLEVSIVNMNNFYGNTLTIKLERPSNEISNTC